MRIDTPSPDQIPQLLRLWKDAFGDWNGFWEQFLQTAFSPSRCRCMLDGSQIAASLCWFNTECAGQKHAYLYAVVTNPAYRGQGLCRRLMENTHVHLSGLGYAGALLVPANEGLRDMYRKMNYRDCTCITERSCEAGCAPVELRAIGPEEYARLRHRFLPEGGVIQEEENMAFLALQAEFFTGNDFLLASYAEDAILHAVELLGNDQAAPGILAALRCIRGTFRIPGKEQPFAMFHPLREDAVIPQYFGFAFD